MKLRNSLGSYLPDDLMIVIFGRLPVKDLLRVTSLNKSWYRFIKSSSFIKSTISNTNNNDRYLLCTHDDDDDNETRRDSSEGDEGEVSDDNVNRLKYYYTLKNLDEDKLSAANTKRLKYCYTPQLFGSFTVKVTYWGSDSTSHSLICNPSSTKFFAGVAYFGVVNHVNNKCKLIAFDLDQERFRDIHFPDEFYSHLDLFSVEPWGKSIALLEIRRDKLTKWVLRNCAATRTSTWEKEVTFELKTSIHMYPLAFTKHGKYLLRDDKGPGSKYLWDFETSQLEDVTSDTGTKDVLAKDSLVGNLVLLDEKTLDPIVETEPCSTQNTFVLFTTLEQVPRRYKIKGGIEKAMKKKRKEMLDKTQNRLQGKGTKRRKEETEMEKPRKKKRKETLDNRLQGRTTKRRKEETEVETPRKKERKENLDKTQIRLQWKRQLKWRNQVKIWIV
ncbi:hypothetical protein POM88_004828 [Heracleum sosnowskyi]|uniref:F-box domain-containing protein n=1 Tax=Heracleum sosnowskyi TaxID=360622 RepID=A0AAD8JL21_9APIA|nr:hypothetical protein POM88_004828 [Heracleum sosnowskyi]